MSGDSRWPLFERFPALAKLPRIDLRSGPTPVESAHPFQSGLWIKRDDLTAVPIGGNKVRSLEFLLGRVRDGDTVTTVGSTGSTHALATAVYAKARGARVTIGCWPQEANPVAGIVAREILRVATVRSFANAPLALSWLWWRKRRGAFAVPAGGTSALGILGHVNAGLELAEQVRAGMLPMPARVVVPLGTGGTTAGLSVGFALGGMRTTIVAARVVPRIVGRAGRVRRLASSAIALIERVSGKRLDSLRPVDVTVAHGVYGGAYGRPLERGAIEARRLEASGINLDPTYAAKAFVAALTSGESSPTLFWLTFDGRLDRK